AAAAAEGLSRADLTHAVAHAARDALDRERGAIARQLAELGETQRRIDLVLASLAERPAAGPAPAPASEPDVETIAEVDAAAEAGGDPAPIPSAARQPALIPPSPPRPAEASDTQPSLPLSDLAPAPATTAARDWSVMAVALDFPKDERDEAGFAALEVATRDRPMAELLQAAEDALTILAQHGIYMEDLEVRLAPSPLWLRFARGERGPEVASVGGVAAEAPVETVRRMMKADPVFRDTAMHLMRRFDAVLRLAAAEPRGEGRLVDLADSRTGRAFMLVAQAVGTFD
ncbi:MAG: hypothetical protein VYD87_12425, partial [Pseudomonadota bacterium]|nr:hypothetical protein [Pseudomonadota bacterium]